MHKQFGWPDAEIVREAKTLEGQVGQPARTPEKPFPPYKVEEEEEEERDRSR